MSIREILTIPDPSLKTPADPVEKIDEDLQRVLRDLSDTVDDSPGVALAAPQIGEAEPAICVDVSQDRRRDLPNHGKVLMVNPEIIYSDQPEVIREGCLSIPKYTADIERYQQLTIRGMDPGGSEIQLDTKGWEAVAFQHEIDHLHGILFLDRINRMKQDLFKRKN